MPGEVNVVLGVMAVPGLAIAGAAMVSIPIIIHLLNRRRFKVLPWAAMQYLLAAAAQTRKRRTVENWLILLLRCLILALMGLALARPTFSDTGALASLAGGQSGLHVIIFDNSYSMAYQRGDGSNRTNLDHARRLAHQLVDRIGSQGTVTVITAGMPAQVVLSQAQGNAQAAHQALDRVVQSWSSTDLAGAMQLALEAAKDRPQSECVLSILTDGTKSAWQGEQQSTIKAFGPQLAAHYHIEHFNVAQAEQSNTAIDSIQPASSLVTLAGRDNEFSAKINSFGTEAGPAVRWSIGDGHTTQSLPQDTDSSSNAQIYKTIHFDGEGAYIVSAQAAAEDGLAMDDTRHLAVMAESALRVLLVEPAHGPESLSGAAAFLDVALAPDRRIEQRHSNMSNPRDTATNSPIETIRISNTQLTDQSLQLYRAIYMADVPRVSVQMADRLLRYVNDGGTVFWFMGDQVDAEAYNQVLLPLHLLPGRLIHQVAARDDQESFRFDFDPDGAVHPLLNIFRGQEKSGLDSARIARYWRVRPSADNHASRVLNYRSSGRNSTADPTPPADGSDPASDAQLQADAAITTQALGAGRVVFISTSADMHWTNLPASPAFVTLVHELLMGSLTSRDAWMNRLVGQRLILPTSLPLTGYPQLTDPQQQPVAISQISSSQQVQFESEPLLLPGIYWLNTARRQLPIAVNLPPDEADVRVLDNHAIAAAMGDVPMRLWGDSIPAQTHLSGRSTDWGWPIMLGVMGLLLVESLILRGPRRHPAAMTARA